MYISIKVNFLGCWKDVKGARVIPEDYGELSMRGCYEKTVDLGYNVFEVDTGSTCHTSSTAEDTYKKYGPAANNYSECHAFYKVEDRGTPNTTICINHGNNIILPSSSRCMYIFLFRWDEHFAFSQE